ncbi:winged helix-turn-helix domain-containing protein, partial [Paucibacter sp. XJ19-41]|uniref:winged helix-turn-helix domain-containing protein n=1 Tax=Paucibacter sp. XJ19-41 TaxID=2927824 RepID=UPI00234B325E
MNNTHSDLSEVLRHEAGDKRIAILRRVGAVGSISQAAREAGVSYKAAWQAIETLSNLAGMPLVEKLVGGAGGGGARLTAEGERVLAAEAAL